VGRGWGEGGGMTQTLYAHINKKKEKKFYLLYYILIINRLRKK
jgi:hypothetical protein